MYSNPLRVELATFVPKDSKLAFAFATAGAPLSATTSTMSAQNVDIRIFSLADRQMLATGQRVFICRGTDPVAEIPRPLFVATSTDASLLVNGTISLPIDTDTYGVKFLVEYLVAMIFEPSEAIEDLRMSNKMSLHDLLSITAAANVLGMKKYTNHLYRRCEAYIRRDLPSYEELDAMVHFAPKHIRLFHLLVSENLAPSMWDNAIPDLADFNKYLSRKPLLSEHIAAAIAKCQENLTNRAHVQQERKENHQVKKRNEHVKVQEEQANFQAQEREKEKAAKDRVFWDHKKLEAAEDEKSVQAKLKLPADKRKFTAREKAHWRRTRGTKLPKGC